MARWRVQLSGDRFDLEELPKLFEAAELQIVVENNAFFLLSSRFAQLTLADEVRALAAQLLADMNGAARLLRPGYRPVKLGSVIEDTVTGRSISILVSRTVTLRSKVDSVRVSCGTSEAQEGVPAITNNWVHAAAKDEAAQHVLRLLGKYPTTWSDLYKIHEILDAHEGRTVLSKAKISAQAVTRFTQTANSMPAIGDEARHAKSSIAAPAHPMSLDDARSLIYTWAAAWLATR